MFVQVVPAADPLDVPRLALSCAPLGSSLVGDMAASAADSVWALHARVSQ